MDNIFDRWLQGQWAAWQEFAPYTDRVQLQWLADQGSKQDFLADFSCKGLVKLPNGQVSEADKFLVGIHFPDRHLHVAEPLKIATILAPFNVWHPNVLGPGMCLGHVQKGTGLIAVVRQIYSILTFQNFSLRDFASEAAMRWTRDQPTDRFPIDPRWLKRPELKLTVTEVSP